MLKRTEKPVRNIRALLHCLRKHRTQDIRKHSEPPQSGHVHYNFHSSPLVISDYDIGELPVLYVNGPLRVDTWTVRTAVTSRSPFIIKNIEIQLKLYILFRTLDEGAGRSRVRFPMVSVDFSLT